MRGVSINVRYVSIIVMPSLPPRLLVGLYVAAAVIVVGALLTSTPPTQPQAVITEAIPSPTTDQPQTYNLFPVADDRATTTPTAIAIAPQPAAAAAALQQEPAPSPTVPTEAKDQGTVNTRTRAALVNIFCTPKTGGPLSGSGIIVDSRGVILTNAHVAQFLLLQSALPEDRINCVVRTGSPAKPAYYAKALYVSTAWIEANASKIAQSHATGNGENDYAFLQIVGSVDDSSMPEKFPFVQMTTNKPSKGSEVLLAGYPAGFLESATIQKGLYITSSFTTIKDLFTFDDPKKVDLVSVGGTVVSQSGASGGSVVRQHDGALVALIATASDAANTASRDLRAITLAHIDRSLAAESKGGIAALLTGDLSKKLEDFNTNTAPALAKKLLDALKK